MSAVCVLAAGLLLISMAGSISGRLKVNGPLACPCERPALCNPVSVTHEKEVLGFVVNKDNWQRYNWTHITTLVMFTVLPPEMMCYAHSKGVRVVLGGLNGFRISDLGNATARLTWISTQLKNVHESFADGINIDIEDPVKNGSQEMSWLTQFVGEVYQQFKATNKNYQVTYDVAWSPNCIDGRCYEAAKFAQVTDFLIIMAYDEQSQILGPCVASANSPLPKTAMGIKEYLDMGIDPNNLVLGLPWYGYYYPCTSLTSHDVCFIPKVPFRGVPCSDAAGSQHTYGDINKLIRSSTAILRWNETLASPYFNYKTSDFVHHQVWFDTPESLSLKFTLAKQHKLKGLAFWNVDSLDYTDSPRAEKEAAEMWQAIDVFMN